MRSYDANVFIAATECYRDKVPIDLIPVWLEDQRNVMYDVDGNVGLARFEYPGCYTAHWFFHVKGKEALDIAFTMYNDLFNNQGAEIVRGVTPVALRGARYLAKRIGFVSLGIMEFADGPEEVMCLTKDAFKQKWIERYGA